MRRSPGSKLVFAVLLLIPSAACNDTGLLKGAPCTNPVSTESSAQAVAPADAVPANAATLIAAMDVPVGVTNANLFSVPKQAAAFAGLGTLTPTKGANYAFLSSGVAGAGTPKTLDVWATTTQNAEAAGGQPCQTFVNGFSEDCVELKFSFVVPEGAQAMAFDFNFLSSEYPEFVGSNFNDMFRVSETSPTNTFENIVFDGGGDPIDVNNVFFVQPCGQLTGTGYDIYRQLAPTECDAGATGMLTTYAPVMAGETVTVNFMIYDLSDAWLDSGVMIDNFRFDAEPIGTPYTATPVPTETPGATPTPAPGSTPDPC